MDFYNFLASQILKILSKLPGAAKDREQKKYLQLVRRLTCYNQGKVADYSFLANESHKELRRCYQHIQESQVPIQDSDYERLEEAYRNASNGLMRKFKAYASINFEYMDEFYKYKNFNSKKPRFCVKSAAPNGAAFEILTLAGSVPPTRERPAYLASQSTGFSDVIRTGTYCLCNNIPKKVKGREYKNSRIIERDVFKFYKLPGWFQNLQYRFTDKPDMSWQRCWRREVETLENVDSSSYYKSTLIVPLSLIAKEGDLSESFLKNFNIQKDKILLGFLCIDHENIDFFNDEEDVDFAYIIADQLSLYLVQYWICTNYSSIFQNSYELLKREGYLD